MYKNGFSILIPTMDNFKYLKASIESLQNFSNLDHEIIVHINGESIKSEEYLNKNKIKYTKTLTNVGVCEGLNKARRIATKDILCYFNDDMIALPGWDTELVAFYEKNFIGKMIIMSSTMIEPKGKASYHNINKNYGETIESFSINQLLNNLESLRECAPNQISATWPPQIVPAYLWDCVGGYSEEYFPGQTSDPDFIKKLYDMGIRDFIGVGRSLVYHFQCKTTNRVPKLIDSKKLFLEKHGITTQEFIFNVIKRGELWKK